VNDQLNFDDVFDLWQLAWWEQPWVWFVAAVAAALGLVGSYYLLSKVRAYASVSNPRKDALKRLYALNPVVGFASQQEYKHFYVEVFAIIKQYLAHRYGYSVYGLTDREFILAARDRLRLPSFYLVTQQILDHSVSIKFARKNGALAQVKHDYSSVLELFSKEQEQ
jgi:LPS O-antigen subunit length determinant protein (WzzB/FepE family)